MILPLPSMRENNLSTAVGRYRVPLVRRRSAVGSEDFTLQENSTSPVMTENIEGDN